MARNLHQSPREVGPGLVRRSLDSCNVTLDTISYEDWVVSKKVFGDDNNATSETWSKRATAVRKVNSDTKTEPLTAARPLIGGGSRT